MALDTYESATEYMLCLSAHLLTNEETTQVDGTVGRDDNN